MSGDMVNILAQAARTERIENQLELARWSSGNALLFGALATAICLVLVVRMYRREARGRITARFRGVLIAVRAGVLVLLGLIGLEPVLVKYIHRRLDAVTILLADGSASMTLTDRYRNKEDAERLRRAGIDLDAGNPGRNAVVETLLHAEDSALLRSLAKRNAVRRFDFARRPVERGYLPRATEGQAISPNVRNGDEPPGLAPADTDATDLAAAVRTALDSLGGAPASAIVLLSDGNINQGESLDTIARMLKLRGVPLYAVGIGDPAPPVNVAVRELSAPRHAFKNDPFNVSVRLEAEGLAEQSINVQLWEQAGPSSPRLVANRSVRPSAAGIIEPVTFEHHASAPGALSLVARVDPLEDESITTDNARALIPPVQILDDKVRILLVSGAPSYDYRYLARMLERDPGIDVSLWLQSADAHAVREGDVIITSLPANQEELFKYDALILMDADPADFDPTWASLVATFVSEHGGGVLFQAGNKYTARFLRNPHTTSLVELLPIVPDPDAEIVLNDLGQVQTRAWPIVIPEQAIFDPILRLAGNPIENRAIWSRLDGIYWHFPVRREKPVASVLMRHSDPRMIGASGPQVLFATQFVGAGRTAWLGINSTWRWRQADERPFNRFWIQTIRYLVEGRLAGGRSRGQILTERDEYEVGQTVPLTLRALDARYGPLIAPELELRVEPPSSAATAGEPASTSESDSLDPSHTIHAVPIPGREGYYQARFTADRPGIYRVSFTSPGMDGAAPAVLTRELPVVRPDLEMRATALNLAALQQLAAATGGRYLHVDEARALGELIPDAGRTQVTRERPRPLWDNATVFGILLALLTTEWILRRQARLL
ncbi:MAG: hypothetical protein HBSAPP02_08080 [Phycisphaerae bacterium]|nr:MAG: hypothetical protein HRU71_00490 [Planctomycetia bacterium]GJQ25776.1 MAG: hypothetical protein HBSAPP02_08080 [Phycisphaerae bacterium]